MILGFNDDDSDRLNRIKEEATEKPFNLDAALRFWDNLDMDRLHDINTLKLD